MGKLIVVDDGSPMKLYLFSVEVVYSLLKFEKCVVDRAKGQVFH